MNERSRLRAERKRKRGKKRRFLLLLLVIGLLFIGYNAVQYILALNQYSDDTGKQDFDFSGEEVKGKINVLLVGVDSRGEEKSRADTIIVAQYNSDSNTPKLMSIMRDSYVDIPGHGKNKINTAYYLGGPELLRQTIKENFGIGLEYYAVVDFKGFEYGVDELFPKGVEIDVEKAMSKGIGVELEPGLQTLNGKELLGYVRFRQDAEGDFGRVRRQQQVLNILKDEMRSVSSVAKIPRLSAIVTSTVDTNLSKAALFTISKDVITGSMNDSESLSIPVQGGYTDQRYSGVGLVLDLDMEKNRQAIDEFLQ
ncbi:LCP family protein [Metabacillus iocasae]|uniref:Regulatory protein MsrR n=1 Tax=Priestia iocasae TaxID=2291674 RepID=A0ABS2QY68_9BACI|nr:LCP family protein [Metabacillus iocasae]MBM7703887.1 LCP family protein required for cell wall assembly [Metabacillus iocasae]